MKYVVAGRCCASGFVLVAGMLLAALASCSSTWTAAATRPAVASGAGLGSESGPEARAVATRAALARIREEGLERSQVMATLSHLTDIIGPRLTGSPNARRANEWTRDRLTAWGLANARLEPWGPFGRGWSLERFSAHVVDPQCFPLTAFPKAWSPGFERPVTGEVVHVEALTESDLDRYRGKLKGAVVLLGATREVQARFDPLAVRTSDEELALLAEARPGAPATLPGRTRATTASERRALFAAGSPAGRAAGEGRTTRRTPDLVATRPSTQPADGAEGGRRSRPLSRPSEFQAAVIAFLLEEGAAALLTPSPLGDGGTLLVASATVPRAEPRSAAGATAPATRGAAAGAGGTAPATRGAAAGPAGRPRVWDPHAPANVPQLSVAIEDYNRLVRMLRQGARPKVELDLRVRFHDQDLMSYNTLAELPGSDLAHEVVMLGAHLDSWHAGTGATDNGAGVAATMEAMRILAATGLRPRRTIRIGLWTGEEQGLLGSKAYVTYNLGRPASAAAATRPAATMPATRPAGAAVTADDPRRDAYDRHCVYLNMDHGTGRIRGLYLQGNTVALPYFKRWTEPLADLGVTTVSLSGTGGTDHVSFEEVGLPGFTMIQDALEYWSRTHHTNADVYDRAQAEDLKQAATVLASLAYQAAMEDVKVPRRELAGR